jgi:hypothetical protein
MQTNRNIEVLNGLLRGEISAVETYDQALQELYDDTAVSGELSACRSSHQRRVELLRSEVVNRGGEPALGSGAWGSFAKLVEGGARPFRKKAAISALEEGEDYGLRQYRDDLKDLDSSARSLLEGHLLSEQQRTHRAMSTLKHVQ